MMSRETIFAALFARLAPLAIGGSPAFVTASRTLRHWDNVTPAEQPALFQSEGVQTASANSGLPTKWMLKGALYVYVHTQNLPPGTTDVVTLLNQRVDAIVAALGRDVPPFEQPLAPPPGPGGTSSGIIGDVRIQGDIETDEGRLGDQAVAVIPFEIQPLI